MFGTATASTSVLQSGYGNTLNNYSNPNTASLSNSANNVSGNLGVNVAAGNFNQQKNDLAAAVSNGQYSTAGSAASQTSTGNTTVNSANYAYGGTYVSLKLNADGSYKGTSDQIGDVYLDTWEGQTHPGGSNTGHIDVDSQAQGAKDLNHDGGAFAFKEKGDVDLKGTVSGFIPAIVGFKTPVTNNASLSNSLQNVSGNVGVNIAAGGGNQQSNSCPSPPVAAAARPVAEPWLLILAQGSGASRNPLSIRTQEPAMRTLILSLLLLVDLTAQAATLGFPPCPAAAWSTSRCRASASGASPTWSSRRPISAAAPRPSRPSWRRPTAPRSTSRR